jgi:hypothetical protein
MKRHIIQTCILAFFLSIITYVYYSFIKEDFNTSKARISLKLSQDVLTKYGKYKIDFSEIDLFKSMFFDEDVIKNTIDSMNFTVSPNTYKKSLVWKGGQNVSNEMFIELSANSVREDIDDVLKTHLYFYEDKIEAYIERKMINLIKERYKNLIPKEIADKQMSDSIVLFLSKQLESYDDNYYFNVNGGILFDPGYTVIKEELESTKIESKTLGLNIEKNKKYVSEIEKCNCLRDVDVRSFLLSVLEVQNGTERSGNKAVKYAGFIFSGTFILAFIIYALSKMVYIPND